MKTFITSILCVLYCIGNSQNILIEFHYAKYNGIPDKFKPELRQGYRNPVENLNNSACPATIISFKINERERVSTVSYKIGLPGIYNIGNGYGGEDIFLRPGDTDIINIESLEGKREYRYFTDSVPNYLSYFYHHSGMKNDEHQFFDSLVFLSGAINSTSITFKQCKNDINTFFLRATKEYNSRMNFLEKYSINHSLQSDFIHLAGSEIKAAYIYNLLTPCIDPASLNTFSELPPNYKDSINTFNFNDDYTFFHTSWQSLAAELYNNVVLSKMNYDQYYSSDQLLQRFRSISLNFDQKIKNELLTSLLVDFILNTQKIPDTLITQYDSICNEKSYIDLISSLNNKEKEREQVDQKQAELTKLINAKGEIISINDLRDSVPILFDCWASWCTPCLEQFPFQKGIDSVFNGRIKFVYLSFDKNLTSWQKKSKQLGFAESYVVQGAFSSDFAKFLKINAIPRYILLNKKNEFISINGIRPSATKKYIQKIKLLL